MKKENKSIQPPRWAQRFLAFYCRPELLEDLQGDLFEFFERNLETRGLFMARIIYIIDVLKFLRGYTIRKPSINSPTMRSVMLTSYIKTSGRAIMRSKLFSGINIAGLAISMSVGLLVISFVSYLLSYDQSLKNKNQIYRVVSSDHRTGEPEMRLATTSLKAGKLIQQNIPGIDAITFLRRGFEVDAHTGQSVIPLSGLYASQPFFNVFSFPLLEGNSASALKEPYSLVLTEKAAKKLFGDADPMGRLVKIDTINYLVTGLMKDIPKLSHLQFEVLASYASVSERPIAGDGDLLSWENIYSNYIYVALAKNTSPQTFVANLNKISAPENALLNHREISLELQPLSKIVIGNPMGNEIGPAIINVVIWVLAGLALIVILSACFNYTNLSLARSLRRSREVGIRKVMGARNNHVLNQFITESLIISLLALAVSFFLFLLIRTQFLSFHPFIQSLVALDLSPKLVINFIVLAVVVGIVAGLLPALFYSRINAVQVLKDVSAIKVFRHISLRKTLIVVQFTFSLIFITATIIGYNQYKGFLSFDLGFTTENILNIKMQGNNDELLVRELSEIPAVKGISKSLIVSSLGSLYGTQMKYNNPQDSSLVDINIIDEHYLPLHNYHFLAGRNFVSKPKNAEETEVIVNQQVLKQFNIGKGDPAKAIGEVIQLDGKKLAIIGVLKDFHYGTLQNKIDPTLLRYAASPGGYINAAVTTTNWPTTLAALDAAWKKVDRIHPIDAKFYDQQIEEAYSQFSVMAKVIGFFSFLAICIASMGLLGMVIYTTEKRLKEISIRKVLGATEGMLVYLLSKGILLLLMIAALIAIPATWLFFDEVVLANFAYHQPIGLGEILIGLMVVGGIAFLMIGVHILKIARSNPAKALKME